jgi:sugar phosphate permease
MRPFLGWVIIGLFYIYQYILQSMLSVIKADIQQHFSANSEQFGTLSAAFLYAYAAIQIPAGIALDKYGPRWIVAIAILFCSLGCYVFSHTTSYSLALIARAILGASSSFAFLGCLCVVALFFPNKAYAFMTGLTLFLGTFGAGIAQYYTLSWVEASGSWQQLFQYFSYIGLIIAFWAAVVIPSRHKNWHPSEAAHNKIPQQLYMLALNPCVWVAGIYASLVYMPSITLAETWGYDFLIHGYHIEADLAFQIVPKIFFGLAIGGPIYGFLESRFWTPFLIIASNIIMIALIVVITTPSIATSLEIKTWSMIFFLIGFMACGLVFSYTRLKQMLPPHIISTATGFIHGINAVSWAAAQQFMGMILDRRLSTARRDYLILDDYLVSMSVLLDSLLICLPFALILSFYKPSRKAVI